MLRNTPKFNANSPLQNPNVVSSCVPSPHHNSVLVPYGPLLWSSFSSILFSFIRSGYFYSASSSSLLLRGAPDTARIQHRNFTPKRQRQLWVKDFSKVPTWRLERESNPWPFGTKGLYSTNAPSTPHSLLGLLAFISPSIATPCGFSQGLGFLSDLGIWVFSQRPWVFSGIVGNPLVFLFF